MYTYIYTQPLWEILLLMLLLPALWSVFEDAAGERRRALWRRANAAVLALSLFLTIHTTLLSRGAGERGLVLMPFSRLIGENAHSEGLRLLVMNAFLFLPFGLSLSVLLPEKWRAGAKIALTAAAGFILSLSIEALQYILYLGTAEADDVLMNTLGALLGVLICYLFSHLIQIKQGTSGH